MRITLPTGVAKERPLTGLSTGIQIKGDFEITMAYEVLHEPEPAGAGQGTGLLLGLDQETPASGSATLARGVRGGTTRSGCQRMDQTRRRGDYFQHRQRPQISGCYPKKSC